MKEFLSIGQFAQMKNVSVKALRYYDKIGILKPAYVNMKNNYRYYTPEQSVQMDIIKLCIELEIPLKSIRSFNDLTDVKKIIQKGQTRAKEKIEKAKRMYALSEDIISSIEEVENLRTPSFISIKRKPRYVLKEKISSLSAKEYLRALKNLHEIAQSHTMNVLTGQGILHDYSANQMFTFLSVQENHRLTRILPEGKYYIKAVKENELLTYPIPDGITPLLTLWYNTDMFDYSLHRDERFAKIEILPG